MTPPPKSFVAREMKLRFLRIPSDPNPSPLTSEQNRSRRGYTLRPSIPYHPNISTLWGCYYNPLPLRSTLKRIPTSFLEEKEFYLKVLIS
jgi:hypothetical protein